MGGGKGWWRGDPQSSIPLQGVTGDAPRMEIQDAQCRCSALPSFQHHLQLGAAAHLCRCLPGHPQAEPRVSSPLPHLPPPVWGSAPRARGRWPRCRVAGPRARAGSMIPAAHGHISLAGGARRGCAAEWETIDLGGRASSCQPPREPRAVPDSRGTLSRGARGSPFAGSCVKGGGTPGRAGFAWSRCDRSGLGAAPCHSQTLCGAG